MNKNFVYLFEKPNYELKGIKFKDFNLGSYVRSIVQLQNGNLACGTENGRINILNIVNWNYINSTDKHTGYVSSLALLQNGYIASGSSDDTIKIWSPILNSIKLINTLNGHNDTITSLKVLNNGNLASCSSDSTVKIWNPLNGEMLFNLKGHNDSVYDMIQLKTGQLVSFGYDKNIIVWNPYNGSLIRILSSGCSVKSSIKINGNDFVIGCLTDMLKVFDSAFNIKFSYSGEWSNQNNVVQLQNGDLASCSSSKSILVWDFNNRSIKYNLTEHSDSVFRLTVLDNGYLASGGEDNNIIIWI